MARILIGSSNIRRFYPCEKVKDYPKYKLEVTTLKRAFEVTIDNIQRDSQVVISVIENLIEKEIGTGKDEDKRDNLRRVMDEFITSIAEAARKNKGARFALAYPIMRPGNDWMAKNYDFIRDEFELAFGKQSELNVAKLDAICKTSQKFDKDGVHLTSEAGKNFVFNLIGMAEDYFEAKLVDLDFEEDTVDKVLRIGKETSASQVNLNLSEIRKVTTEMKGWKNSLEKSLQARFSADNLMFARLRDEMDSETNRKREDRTLVTNLVDPDKLPKPTNERNEELRKIAKEFCEKIKENFDGEVMFATTSGRPDRGNLMLEFRLDSVAKARDVRKAFAVKRSADNLPAGMDKVQVSTVITLATKVRIEIMKAIAKKIESHKESAYVPGFLPRPILQIKSKTGGPEGRGGKFINSLTFAESIQQYGGLVDVNDLTPAYKKAGQNFRGTMRQHFAVLEENVQLDRTRFNVPPPPIDPRGSSSALTSSGRGLKRLNEDSGDGDESTKRRI